MKSSTRLVELRHNSFHMRRSAYILIAALLASACNEALMESQRFGTISLSLSPDVEVVAQTKADDAVDCDAFIINVSGQTFIGNSYSEEYLYGELTEDVPVPYGTYVISAQSCTEEVAETANGGDGCARFAGASGNVDVLSAEPVHVSITCPMVNAKATLTFDESFLADFGSPYASLTVGGSRTVELESVEESLARTAYFNVETSAELVYTVKGTIDGRRLTYTGRMDIEPAKWAKIVIRSNHNGQIGGPDIWVDDDMSDNSFTETIDPTEGEENSEGSIGFPSIIVDATLDDAVVVDCIIDVY